MVGLAWSVCRGGKEIGVPELFSGSADCVAYTCWHETPGKGPISDKNPAPVIEFLHWKAEQLRWNVIRTVKLKISFLYHEIMPKLIEYFSFRQGFSGPHVQGGRRGRGQGRRGVWWGDRDPSSFSSRGRNLCVWRIIMARRGGTSTSSSPRPARKYQPPRPADSWIQWPRMNLGNQQMVGQLGAGRRGHTPGLCSPCRSGLILMIINSLLRNYV